MLHLITENVPKLMIKKQWKNTQVINMTIIDQVSVSKRNETTSHLKFSGVFVEVIAES